MKLPAAGFRVSNL